MATPSVPFNYKEARLSIEPAAYPGSTISFQLPPHSVSTFSSRSPATRTVLTESFANQSEDDFALRQLSSDASIFFRRGKKTPRNVLWRVLHERKTLEVQAADLSREKFSKGEPSLTLLFHFPNAIRPYGVAMAEPDKRDMVAVFVLTTANELYTLNLHQDFFIRSAASDIPIESWCKTFQPSAFGFYQPYRLFAISAQELYVSLHDGTVMRLVKKSGDDGSVWRDTLFTESRWGTSFKGLISWKSHNTVRFGALDLEPSSAASIALSPKTSEGDSEHFWTVSLDHTLKAWNLTTGKPGLHTDILGESFKDPQKQAQYFIGASQAQLLQVVNVPGTGSENEYCIVTYSPKKHQFKFWGVRDADAEPELGIYDIQPEISFVPPVDELMDTTVWNLEEFYVKATAGWRGTEIWIRARSGPYSRIFSLQFNLLDSDSIGETWRRSWVAVAPEKIDSLRGIADHTDGPLADAALLHNPGNSELWLEYLSFPGRFTEATLETALHVYRHDTGEPVVKRQRLDPTVAQLPLMERIYAAIVSKVQDHPGTAIDYDQYAADLATQWRVFYGLVKDLHKRRSTVISLAYDEELGMAWLLHSNFVTPIRKCANIELLRENEHIYEKDVNIPAPLDYAAAAGPYEQTDRSEEVAKLLIAARRFRQSYPFEFPQSLELAIQSDISQGTMFSVQVRMKEVDLRSGLCSLVTDDDVSRLHSDLAFLGGIGNLQNEDFQRVLARLTEVEDGHPVKKDSARYGMSFVERVAEETLETGFEILLDVLVLVVFMHRDYDPGTLSQGFDATELYPIVVDYIKQYRLLLWMSRHIWPTSPAQKQSEANASFSLEFGAARAPVIPVPKTQTVLEALTGPQAYTIRFPHITESASLTYWPRAWIFTPFKEKGYETVANDTLAFMILHKQYDLAAQFVHLLPDSIWGTYLKARLYLGQRDFQRAATHFRRAAFDIGVGHFDIEQADNVSLLDLAQRDYFSDGLPKYYQHVLSLFEKPKAHSYVIEFAQLGLEALAADALSAHVRTDNASQYKAAPHFENVRTDLLTRLFHAALYTHQFHLAYTTLNRHSNPILRSSALHSLISEMVVKSTPPQTSLLVDFPFVTLAAEVDTALRELCTKTLNITTASPYYTALAAWRMRRGDWRGAAEILYARIQRLQDAGEGVSVLGEKIGGLGQSYLELINLLACQDEKQRWLLAEPVPVAGAAGLTEKFRGVAVAGGKDGKSAKHRTGKDGKRKVVTLEDVRKEYQDHLDWVEAVQLGRFPMSEATDGMLGGDEFL